MANTLLALRLYRKNFGKIERVVDISNLIEMQKESYHRFLQKDVEPEARSDYGLQGVFKSVFPIRYFRGVCSIEFVDYGLGDPKYDVEECQQRGMTYEVPMKIRVRLIVHDLGPDSKIQAIRDIKEQEIYFGTLPLMTEHGTFIINGTERVVASQLHRSPGLFIDHDKAKIHSSGKIIYSARLIPLRGSWIDFEFDPEDILYVRIDRRRKFPATILLKALGYTPEEILNFFYKTQRVYLEGETIRQAFIPEMLVDKTTTTDIPDPKSGKVLVKKGKRLTPVLIQKMKRAGVLSVIGLPTDLVGRVVAHDILDPESGEVLAACNEELSQDKIDQMLARGIRELDLLFIDGVNVSPCLRDTLEADKTSSVKEAILEIYRRLRHSNRPNEEVATTFFQNLFFNPELYDLSPVGRVKLDLKLRPNPEESLPLTKTTLDKEDILLAIRELITQKDCSGPMDDIDHLGNCRVPAVGELLESQFQVGLVMMERAIKKRMAIQDLDTLMPHQLDTLWPCHLVDAKPVQAVINKFFRMSEARMSEAKETTRVHLEAIGINLELEKAQDWTGLLAHCRRWIQTEPNYPVAWHSLGEAYGELGRHQKAIEAYRGALCLKPDYGAAWFSLGVANAKLGRYSEAIEAFLEAQRLGPDYANAWYSLGLLYGELGRHQEEIEAYEEVLYLKPDYTNAWYNLGVAYAGQDSYPQAIKAYREVLRLKPDYAEAWCNLGAAYEKLGHYPEAIDTKPAIEAYREALRLMPDYAEAWSNLGAAYAKLGHYGEAIEAYREVLRFNPDLAELWYILGALYGLLGRHQEAIEAFLEAQRLKPDDAEAWYNLGVAYAGQDSYLEAIKAYREALRLKPDYAEAWNKLGVAYGGLDRYPEAIEASREALRLKLDDADAWSNLGVAYAKVGRYPEAIEACREALRFKHDFAEVWYMLGALYEKLGRHQEEIEAYLEGLRLKPDNAVVSYNLGVAYSKLDRYPEAIEAYRKALRLKPDDANTWSNLALAYDRSGNRSAALDALKELRRNDPQEADKVFNLIVKP
jgi:tetratricopeptide (TPR) repeat protein